MYMYNTYEAHFYLIVSDILIVFCLNIMIV